MKNFKSVYKTRIIEEIADTCIKYVPQYLCLKSRGRAWVTFETAYSSYIVGNYFGFDTLEEAKEFIRLRTYVPQVVWESE